MTDLLRETAAGYFIRLLSGKKLLRFPEEIQGFEPPTSRSILSESTAETPINFSDSSATPADYGEIKQDPEMAQGSGVQSRSVGGDEIESADLDMALHLAQSKIIPPVQTKDGIILVDWYSLDDPANPHNWSGKKKTLVSAEICSLTFAIYVGSSAYTPSIPGVSEQFGVSEVVASLGLALYVIAYGIGPLLWSPLSEIPRIGRNGLYIGTLFISVLLMIPTALTNNLACFFVLRFLIGFFSSPSLSTGPASFGDIMDFRKLPYVVTLWSSSAYLAPAIGPLIGGYAVQAKNWHWSLLELLWLCAPLFIILFFLLPETSTDNILLRRASRLRILTGNPHYKSQSELNQANMSPREITFNALVKPWQLNALDPAVLFSTVYVSLCYSIFYTFFEAFPLVFPVMHGFGLGATGLAFIAVPIGLMVAIPAQLLHYYFYAEPFLVRNGAPEPEYWLRPALIGNVFGPIGLFIFAWTSSPNIHWIVPLIGVATFQGGSYHISNGLFTYIPRIYPSYAASLFAANAFVRSLLAGAAVLFARPMYLKLGIGGGVSLLAGLMCVCSVLMYVLYFMGPALRRRSRFVV